jgi:hypothetical protein
VSLAIAMLSQDAQAQPTSTSRLYPIRSAHTMPPVPFTSAQWASCPAPKLANSKLEIKTQTAHGPWVPPPAAWPSAPLPCGTGAYETYPPPPASTFASARWASCPSAQAGEIKKNYRNFIFLHYNHYWSIRTLQIWHLMHTGDQFGAHGGHQGIKNLFPLSTLFSSTRSINHVFLNLVSLDHVCFINFSLSLFPSACFPQPYFPQLCPASLTFPQHHPHNQRISSLHLNYENYAQDIILSSQGFTMSGTFSTPILFRCKLDKRSKTASRHANTARLPLKTASQVPIQTHDSK